MYYCTACSVYVAEESAGDHDRSTAHLLSTTKAPALRKGEFLVFCFRCLGVIRAVDLFVFFSRGG